MPNTSTQAVLGQLEQVGALVERVALSCVLYSYSIRLLVSQTA
jgi:hypothetical protein